MSETYTCAYCLRTFEKTWTDEDAAAEARRDFGEIDDPQVVCDDCYQEFVVWYKKYYAPMIKGVP